MGNLSGAFDHVNDCNSGRQIHLLPAQQRLCAPRVIVVEKSASNECIVENQATVGKLLGDTDSNLVAAVGRVLRGEKFLPGIGRRGLAPDREWPKARGFRCPRGNRSNRSNT